MSNREKALTIIVLGVAILVVANCSLIMYLAAAYRDGCF